MNKKNNKTRLLVDDTVLGKMTTLTSNENVSGRYNMYIEVTKASQSNIESSCTKLVQPPIQNNKTLH